MIRKDEINNKDISLTSDRGPASQMVPVNQYVLNRMMSAIVEPYAMSTEEREAVIRYAMETIADPEADHRAKQAAAKILQAADEINIRRLEVVDKITRLDNGEATENVQIKLSFPNSRAQLNADG